MAKEQSPSTSHGPLFIGLFFLVAVVFAVLLQNPKINNTFNFQKSQKPESGALKTFSLMDRQMDVSADKWDIIQVSPAEVNLVVKGTSINEHLTVKLLSKNDKQMVDLYKNKRTGSNYLKTVSGEIFQTNCDGSSECNGAIINGNVYTFSWQKTSNISKPIFFVGDWVPPTPNITSDEIWEILKTIK